MREIELHRSLDHVHVVKFHSFFEDDQNIYFILEYCARKVCHVQFCFETTHWSVQDVFFFVSFFISTRQESPQCCLTMFEHVSAIDVCCH